MGLTTAIDNPCVNSRPTFLVRGRGEDRRVIPIKPALHEMRQADVTRNIEGKRVPLCLECLRAHR